MIAKQEVAAKFTSFIEANWPGLIGWKSLVEDNITGIVDALRSMEEEHGQASEEVPETVEADSGASSTRVEGGLEQHQL